MRRRQPVERRLAVPGHQCRKRFADKSRVDGVEAPLAAEMRRQPVVEACCERFVGDVGPFLAAARAEKGEPGASAAADPANGRLSMPLRRIAATSAAVTAPSDGRAAAPSASTTRPSRRMRRARTLPVASSKATDSSSAIAAPKCVSISSAESGAAARMRAFSAAPCRLATARYGSRASASAGSSTPPRPFAITKAPGAPRAMAIRSGKAKAMARPASPMVAGVDRRSGVDDAGEAGAERQRVAAPLVAAGAQRLQPVAEIAAVAAEPRFGEEHGEAAGGAAEAERGGADQHVAEPRRHGEAGELQSLRGQPPVAVDGAEPGEQRHRLVEGGARRRVEKGEAGRVGDAPGDQVERQRGEVGIEDLRPVERRQRAPSGPRPTGDSRCRAPCARRGRGAGRRWRG